MNTIILYHSKTGFTKRYAQWLAQELGCIAHPAGGRPLPDWNRYEVVIFASWFHAGKIRRLDWFKKLPLDGKERIVLVTGAMPADAAGVSESLAANFKEDSQKYRAFYVPGGLNYEKMGIGDRLMMKAFAGMLNSKKDKSPEEAMMAENIGHSFDLSRREYLSELVEYVNGLG